MSTVMNQDWALAQRRAEEARLDPPFYSVMERRGGLFIWMNIEGNVGWYKPEMKDGGLIGIRVIAFPQPSEEESVEEYKTLNYLFKLLSPKMRAKIEHALSLSVSPYSSITQ